MPQAAISLAHAWTLTDEERSHIWFDLKRGVVYPFAEESASR